MPSDPVAEMLALLPRLRRFALGLTGSRDAADELVQSACERALSRLHQWTPGTRLDSWMYRITQTLWISELRREKVRADAVDPATLEGVAWIDGREQSEVHLTLARAVSIIGELPEEQRAVLLLVCVEGFSYKEVAETLDLELGTVMSRLARARNKLRLLLRSNSGEHRAVKQ